MTTYNKNTDDRKILVTRLRELTGTKGQYTGIPRYAYDFEHCSVERDGTLTVQDGMDMSVIEKLLSEGLILPNGQIGPEVQMEDENNITEEMAEESDAETQAEPEAPVIQGGDSAEDASEDDAGNGAEGTADAEETTDTENAAEGETEENHRAAFFIGEGTILKPEISLPMASHTGYSLRNLVNLLYGRGKLVSKSTGGAFGADEGLVELLKDENLLQSRGSALEAILAYQQENGCGLTGVALTQEKVSFTGFPEEGDPGKIRAFQDLAAAMNKQALTQNRIQPKIITEDNEKYIHRIWLVRIGLDGNEYKETRRYLLENLSGHTAFHTTADEERWKARQKAKRDARKAEMEAMRPAGTEAMEGTVSQA